LNTKRGAVKKSLKKIAILFRMQLSCVMLIQAWKNSPNLYDAWNINTCRLYLLVQKYHAFYNQSKTDVYNYCSIIPFPYFLPCLGVVLKDSAMKENLNFIEQ
jgi:hypothetical protein